MSTTTLDPGAGLPTKAPARPHAVDDPSRRLDWRRLHGATAVLALVGLVVGAVAQTLGTVVAGQMAQDPAMATLLALAACLVGGALLDSAGLVTWAGVVDRAEGRLRGDLLTAALRQPLAALGEQAAGEILDRVDDDTHAVGALVRRQLWAAGRTVAGVVPMWAVAGVTWWPGWFVFPALGAAVWWLARPRLGEIARRKVEEEKAWTDHAAAFEEAVAARDDLRTSLGRPFALRRVAELSAVAHRRFKAVLDVEFRLVRTSGLLLHGMLAAVAVVGVAIAATDGMSVAALVTLFLVTARFVGQVDNLVHHLPDIQEGLGAVTRLRQMLDVEPEPTGGDDVPDGPLDVEFRGLDFAYPAQDGEPSFALRDVNLSVPAGHTVALVGRTGSGKSTLASVLSRAVEPPRGTVLLGGADVRDLDLQRLRAAVGVVTQRTELLAGTLGENITLFADVAPGVVEAAVRDLGLADWVAGLPDGLDTLLGPGGTRLSAGEEQLVAFARLLVRDVQVVVLDEATARMDPLTEARVVAASERLLRGRTGVLVAHRLSTIERAELVAVLDHGRVVQQGPRAELAAQPGRFRSLLEAGASGLLDGEPEDGDPRADDVELDSRDAASAAQGVDAVEAAADAVVAAGSTVAAGAAGPAAGVAGPATGAASPPGPDGHTPGAGVGARRRTGPPPALRQPGDGLGLGRAVLRQLAVTPRWGLLGAVLFLVASLISAQGAAVGFLWGHTVDALRDGGGLTWPLVAMSALLVAAPLSLAWAIYVYPRWWIEVLLRVRMAVLAGQTQQHRLPATPPGEIVARAMDADRFVRYADRWVDFVNGLTIVVVTALLGWSWQAGAVLLAVMVVPAAASALGRPIAGRSAARSSAARARFGRSLVSALDAARTVKLAARTPQVHAHLSGVDAGRVKAAIFEHRVQAVLDGVPTVMIQVGVVAAWYALLHGSWNLATALLVANAVTGFGWFGTVAGAVVTEAPGTRAWLRATSRFADGADLCALPEDVDLVSGAAPAPAPGARDPLDRLELRGLTAVHDDGTIGVADVDLAVRRGELVLLLGRVGSGKSSLLAALAGLVSHTGSVRWNGAEVPDAQTFLRPGRVAYVAQVPRVLSGTFADNVRLDHARDVVGPLEAARMTGDVAEAGGPGALVGHRGVRLSGGQVQRLALARALAADAEVLLADDVSSALDATTEIELWDSLRSRGVTVLGSTSKHAALARADRVVVLVDGSVAAVGPWRALAPAWSHLAG
ncbi:ATP-binding cassette domain-containing protein [Xylanimonas ulmi]|uniref:ABC-type multidrug transport system fused ATPase/permease subunit n=1 Tax=Xylanimonas ulmi TaxID=228973 RepID=A0A4V2EYJ9_9MICO|nr:ABC transporter ATP-binding protein [Xylanibacterium ulmi]RZS63250.1 ABC-type multidrug transport system fused ATPase/permease subunit [Xylanibacterium ulmi]